LVRLQDLFQPVLEKHTLDIAWPAEKQLDAVLELDSPWIALTQSGKYLALVRRESLLTEVLKSLAKKRSNG
jgi:hypothetical protein